MSPQTRAISETKVMSSKIVDTHEQIEIPVFHGLYPCGWISRVERFFRFGHYTDEEKLRFVSLKLEDNVLSWFKHISFHSWKDFKSRLYVRFGNAKFFSARITVSDSEVILAEKLVQQAAFVKEENDEAKPDLVPQDKRFDSVDLSYALDDLSSTALVKYQVQSQSALVFDELPFAFGIKPRIHHVVSQVFDKMFQREHNLPRKSKKKKGYKCWKFKFKVSYGIRNWLGEHLLFDRRGVIHHWRKHKVKLLHESEDLKLLYLFQVRRDSKSMTKLLFVVGNDQIGDVYKNDYTMIQCTEAEVLWSHVHVDSIRVYQRMQHTFDQLRGGFVTKFQVVAKRKLNQVDVMFYTVFDQQVANMSRFRGRVTKFSDSFHVFTQVGLVSYRLQFPPLATKSTSDSAATTHWHHKLLHLSSLQTHRRIVVTEEMAELDPYWFLMAHLNDIPLQTGTETDAVQQNTLLCSDTSLYVHANLTSALLEKTKARFSFRINFHGFSSSDGVTAWMGHQGEIFHIFVVSGVGMRLTQYLRTIQHLFLVDNHVIQQLKQRKSPKSWRFKYKQWRVSIRRLHIQTLYFKIVYKGWLHRLGVEKQRESWSERVCPRSNNFEDLHLMCGLHWVVLLSFLSNRNFGSSQNDDVLPALMEVELIQHQWRMEHRDIHSRRVCAHELKYHLWHKRRTKDIDTCNEDDTTVLVVLPVPSPIALKYGSQELDAVREIACVGDQFIVGQAAFLDHSISTEGQAVLTTMPSRRCLTKTEVNSRVVLQTNEAHHRLKEVQHPLQKTTLASNLEMFSLFQKYITKTTNTNNNSILFFGGNMVTRYIMWLQNLVTWCALQTKSLSTWHRWRSKVLHLRLRTSCISKAGVLISYTGCISGQRRTK
ncbi:hypothetical protein ISN45_At02g000240 [Arabidopsis thaliana x Arabidopsis arenosa]|uniref:Uncharacterized protein n=2 Tax=Arabidopsis TaxID=3701 RepID=A0A178VNN7_ARATH|nr:hypothetical protein ISN45_At02g000240 [Arabidopsis thaliana x Arabidopsis arenosa]OAP07999.1 hypothetical protein AXX17_AT2G00210 [Arabidopsis thaliana]